MSTRRNPADEVFDEIKRLRGQEDKTIERFKDAQHTLFIYAEQDYPQHMLEEARVSAVSYYEAYIDLVSQIKVLEKRYSDLTD